MIRPPKSNCDVWLKFQFQFWTKKSVQFEIRRQNWILIKGGCWNTIKINQFPIKNYHFWSIFDEFWTISILKCQLKDQKWSNSIEKVKFNQTSWRLFVISMDFDQFLKVYFWWILNFWIEIGFVSINFTTKIWYVSKNLDKKVD